ncbi:hypothetical protein [Actinokineospora inagensis]|uniref:hypothetical protein n=1 Tax=Actinokineospora inagensis TaxID=103730 RepID=UPI00041EEF6D|nr:hypothetical protein [Actinokineospora inagensis]
MSNVFGQGYSASIALVIDFCEITTNVTRAGTEIDFNAADDFSIMFSPRGLDNLIAKATAAREEYRKQYGQHAAPESAMV